MDELIVPEHLHVLLHFLFKIELGCKDMDFLFLTNDDDEEGEDEDEVEKAELPFKN